MANKTISLDRYGSKALELALNGKSFFMSGKAGSGKTTVLRRIAYYLRKKGKQYVVVAPTGVAAKNAQGVTIHSFLDLPIDPYRPDLKNKKLYALSDEKIEVVRHIDTILIDEISMVRCDLLDAMDDVLRFYRKNKHPFGGVQIILVGDLYQLNPVAPEDEWEILKKVYDTEYFFSSKAFQKLKVPMLELLGDYRQKDDQGFLKILNEIREGHMSAATRRKLESRFQEDFVPEDKDGYICLTTHNYKSRRDNRQQLNKLRGRESVYEATLDRLSKYRKDLPTEVELKLKKNARVMFTRNDYKNDRPLFVNGTLGVVKELHDDLIVVQTDSGDRVLVERDTMHFYKYIIDEAKNKISKIEEGTFTQFPLKLAWSMTIHKSQGLTFDKVVIDAGKAFAPGQVYVALSRCRSLDGIVLTSRIKEDSIELDERVQDFLKQVVRIVVPDEPETALKKRSSKQTAVSGACKIPFGIQSKSFTHWACRLGTFKGHYFLQAQNICWELAPIPAGWKSNLGSIWIRSRSIDERGLRLVHVLDDEEFLIGYLLETDDGFIFTDPEGQRYELQVI